jgi:hypothetical protein
LPCEAGKGTRDDRLEIQGREEKGGMAEKEDPTGRGEWAWMATGAVESPHGLVLKLDEEF